MGRASDAPIKCFRPLFQIVHVYISAVHMFELKVCKTPEYQCKTFFDFYSNKTL